MESTKNVKDLEKEIQELRLKITSLEEGLKNAETFINFLKNNPANLENNSISKNNTNPENNPVSSTEVPTESNDKDNKSEVSITILSDDKDSTKPVNKNKLNVTPLITFDDDVINNDNAADQNSVNEDNEIEKAAKKSNAESWIGKILMGALASLLVFIALITFAKVLLPYLTDTIKIILMFVTSFILTITGFIFNKKKPENTFYKALLGCGSACIYISILITNAYFKAISSIVMYILIGLWAVLIIFLKKDKDDWLFFAIGNLGYFVSVIFAVGLNDKSLIIPLLAYVVMISVVYQIMYWKNKRLRHIQGIINAVSILIFQMIMTLKFEKITEVIIVGVVAMVFIFIFFMEYMFIDLVVNEKKPISIAIINTSAYLFCIYLSKIVASVYFNTISLIVLYVLVALWTILNIFFKKDKKNWIFFTVGNILYLGSIISSAKLNDLNDKFFIIPILIYTIIINMVYLIMYWKYELQRNVQSTINVISLLILQVIMFGVFKKITEVIIVGTVSLAYAFIAFIAYTVCDYYSYKREHFYFAAVDSMVYLASYFFLDMVMNLKLHYIISFIVVIIPAIALEGINMYWRIKKLSVNESIINSLYTGALFYGASMIIAINKNFLFNSGIIIVVFSLIVIYGYIRKDSFFKIQGWALIILCMITEATQRPNWIFISISVLIVLASFIVEGMVLNNSEPFKIFTYIILIGWIMRLSFEIYDFSRPTIEKATITVVAYGILAILNMVLILTKFYKTKDKEGKSLEDKKSTHVLLDVFNLIYMLFGVIEMSESKGRLLQFIYMAIVFALASINLPVKEKGNPKRYIYASIKFGLLIIYSLNIFDTPNFVISICMIAFAVICITIGFKNRAIGKELRIFGLGMTLVFVVKFIIIDIKYDSSVLKALSYLISGLLCFGISAIYNYFEKKGKNSE